jgi:glycosyltransferase involved in cell wall biosynthesis
MVHSRERPPESTRSLKDSTQLAGKRAVAIVFSSYPGDPRPRRAAEALAKEGMNVEVICLKETDEEAPRESFNGVEITRISLKRRRGGKLTYIAQYGAFLLFSGVILAFRACRRRYALAHIHNMPDFLVFSALVPKILGAKVILDLHDPMPELMMTIFGLREQSFSVRVLKLLEKLSLRFADAVLTVNQACKNIFSTRSCPATKVTVIMNSPDAEIFRERSGGLEVTREVSNPFVIMYHGSLVERHGLDLAVTALGKIKQSIPQAELRIYGRSTPYLQRVINSVRESPLREGISFLGPKNLEQIVQAIEECDVGIIPNRRSIFTELNTPTRIFEYLSQGKPVIAPRAPGILDYFGPEELILFDLGDPDDLAAKIEFVFENPRKIRAIVERGQEVYRAHTWAAERLRFIRLTNELLEGAELSRERVQNRSAPVLGTQE